MSEILYDAKYTNIDINSTLGLNLTGNNSRVKHTGSGTLSLQSVSGQILIKAGWNSGAESIKLQSSYGGILLNSAKTISLQTSDTSNGIQIGTNSNVPITIGNSNNTLAIKSNMTISGDFTVTGTTVQHNVATYTVDAPLIVSGNGQSSPNYDLGFLGIRGSSNIAVFWDESEDEFAMVTTASTGGATSVAISGYANLRIADLNAVNLTGTLQTAAQPNITSVGTLGSLTLGGDINLNSNDLLNATTITLSTISPASSDINVSMTTGRLRALTFKDGSTNYLIFDTNSTLITASQTVNLANGFRLGGTTVSASATELNILDGVTATTNELNILDGVTATTNELNILDGVTATTNELNILDGVTATTNELNILDGVTATTNELNILDGLNSTTTELNYLAGLTIGSATASKALVLDGSKGITGITSLTATTLGGTLSTAAQTNVTSLGVLTGLTASGTVDFSSATLTLADDQISGDKVSGGTIGTVTITALAGDLSLGGNNITNVGNLAGTLTTAAQTNITSVGTLTSFTAATEATVNGTTTIGGKLSLTEGSNNGSNKVTIKAPDDLSGNYTLTLPDNDGASNQYLQTDGNGALSWTTHTLSGASDTSISSPSNGDYLIYSGGNWINTASTPAVTTSGDVTLDNSGNNTQYINLTYNATNTNHWRIAVNSSGNLDFERYDGASWVSKFTVT